MENNTAKHFALQLGALITLYITIGALISLLFGIITLRFPDELSGTWERESASNTIRFAMALLIVFFPAYMYLTRVVNNIRRTAHNAYLSLTKWLIYLSILVGSIVILCDFVAVIYNFLNGELTVRFLSKSFALFAVVGSALYYYIRDAKEYWLTHESASKKYGIIVSLCVVATLPLGYSHIDTPKEVRERAADTLQINNLRSIQNEIFNHHTRTNTLPQDLAEVIPEYNAKILEAPEGRSPYTYRTIEALSFELCATFAHPSDNSDYIGTYYTNTYPTEGGITDAENWKHDKGTQCFIRTIVPITKYPAQ